MTIPVLFTIGGCILIAAGVSKAARNPLLMVVGVALAAISIPLQVVASAGLFDMIGNLALSFGLGILGMAAVMKAKDLKASPFLVIGAICLAIAGLAHLPALGNNSAESEEIGSFLLELGPDDSIDEVADVISLYDATYEQAFPTISDDVNADLSKVYIIKGAKKILKKLIDVLLDDTENVDSAELNFDVSIVPLIDGDVRQYQTSGIVADDPLAIQQWSLAAAQINDAHEFLKDAAPQRKAIVAILDTGVDAGHEDISGTFTESPAGVDQHGHGTHCAGIAGAATNNGIGIASLNWEGRYVDIKSYAALGDNGMGTVESIAQAIIDATTDGADVISMSLGVQAPFTPKVVVDAVKFALQRDVIIVAAAGNANKNAIDHMPSNIDGVISVAAVDERLRKASFSNTNMDLSRPIAAPGVNIMSLEPAGRYGSKSGTSMATPLVAGLIGTMRALNPSITADETYQILHSTGTVGRSVNQTGRVINAAAALQQSGADL